MDIVKVLKRRDASSVVVAIIMGLFVSGAVQALAYRPASWLSGDSAVGGGWTAGLWLPIITLVVELIILEIVLRVYIALAGNQSKK